MDLIILDKPAEFYAFILFNANDDEINIFCPENNIDAINKTRYLMMRMRYFGYTSEGLEVIKERQTKSGQIVKDNLKFTLKKPANLKKITKELDTDREIKLIKISRYRENGRMIFIKKVNLARLSGLSVQEKEDYNNIIERLIDHGKS